MSVMMDSLQFHQPGNTHRITAAAGLNHPLHPVDHRGAVQKRTAPRHRSISTTQVDRLHQLALDQADHTHSNSLPSPALDPQWLTPQHSPASHLFQSEAASIEPFEQWAIPTPPRSDPGVPNVTFDANEIPVTAGITASDFDHFEQSTASGDMSSLGFLLPSQYGSGTLESEPSSYIMDQNYIPPPVRMSQPATTSGAPAYAQTTSSSPALYQSKSTPIPNSGTRRPSELSVTSNPDPSYGQTYRRPTNSYDSMSSADYSIAPSQTIASMSGISPNQAPSPSMGANSASKMLPPYTPSVSRSPSLYNSGMYAEPFTTAPSATQMYASSGNMNYPPPFVGSSVNEVLAKPLGSDSSIRVLNQRPKPQCWEHGCNGRQFSTFSNLLRHQREKSGTAAKSYCPKCGAEFTRTTARNGHLAHDKCTTKQQQQRPSEGR